MESVPFTIAGPNGPLHGLADLPELPGERPAVVICHGFKGFMEWGFFPAVAELLASRGFVAVRFNFSGAGQRPGEDSVSDLAAFKANTHSRELADLLAVTEATGREIAPGRVDRSRLGLFGHSRGGAAAVLAAAKPALAGRVKALVTWAAVATLDRYTPEQKEAWRRDGVLPVVNSRTGQELELGLGLLEDVETNGKGSLDLETAAARRWAPWLIVHGEEDESVPVREAMDFQRWAGGEKELLLISGASHTFGSRHPFQGPTPHLTAALNATQSWFRRHL